MFISLDGAKSLSNGFLTVSREKRNTSEQRFYRNKFLVFTQSYNTFSEEGVILSSEYWSLLDSVLADSKTKPGSSTWLSSIVGKLPFATITQNIVNSFQKLDALGDGELLSKIVGCFEILWPLASRRMNVDSLADCFGNTVLALASEESQRLCSNTKIMEISSAIAKTFRLSLANSANKKKVCSVIFSLDRLV